MCMQQFTSSCAQGSLVDDQHDLSYITYIEEPTSTPFPFLSLSLIFFCFMEWWIFRADFHHGPWSRTVEDGIFLRSNLMVQLPWSDFLDNRFTKPLGPSLGVNQMWTKKDDHAPKSECANIFKYISKNGI